MAHSFRLWMRQPMLALAAIVSLGLGIGANTAIFSVLNAVVLRPLPFADADRTGRGVGNQRREPYAVGGARQLPGLGA